MSELKVRVHTLKFTFGPGSHEPSDAEMFDFCREWQMSSEEIYSIHRDNQAKAIFVKFKGEKQMKAMKGKLEPVLKFKYRNGTHINVLMSEADETFKYVRIFNLPPEIEDKDIHQVLSEFGVVRQQVRERYHQDTGFPVFSTVRGAYMEITKELPAQIRVRHFQARVYYDGLVNKCFICKSSEHVKASCPRKSAKAAIETGMSYSAVLTGTKADSANQVNESGADTPVLKPNESEDEGMFQPQGNHATPIVKPTEPSFPPNNADKEKNKRRSRRSLERNEFIFPAGPSVTLAQKMARSRSNRRKANATEEAVQGKHPKFSKAGSLSDLALADLFDTNK